MLLLYGALVRRATTERRAASGQIYALAVGYLMAWALFSLGATALQRLLATLLFLSSMMEVTSAAHERDEKPRMSGCQDVKDFLPS